MDACAYIVCTIYVVAAIAAMISIFVRSKGSIEDIERYSLKNGIVAWYLVRMATVIILIGGLINARHLIHKAVGRLA